MLWDTHMHTHFSGDSEADSAAMAHAAVAKKLSGICITDHLDYDTRMIRIYSSLILINTTEKSTNYSQTFLMF